MSEELKPEKTVTLVAPHRFYVNRSYDRRVGYYYAGGLFCCQKS